VFALAIVAWQRLSGFIVDHQARRRIFCVNLPIDADHERRRPAPVRGQPAPYHRLCGCYHTFG
jgi:hypothetical protein